MFKKNYLAKLVTLSLLVGSAFGVASGAQAEVYTEPQTVNGGSKVLSGNDTISINKSTSEQVVALLVSNGGRLTNEEDDTLAISNTNSSGRADGLALWDSNSYANLHGITGITVSGKTMANGMIIYDGSSAYVYGNGTAFISSSVTAQDAGADGIYMAFGDNTVELEGFKSVSAYSEKGNSRAVDLLTGDMTISGVEMISAYGGNSPVDPSLISELGLAYAVALTTDKADVSLDLNGNNTEITATSACSRAVGLFAQSAYETSQYKAILHADGIKKIVATSGGESGAYSGATGIGVHQQDAGLAEAYVNRESGSPSVDIEVTATKSKAYAVYAIGGKLEANIGNVSANGLTSVGIFNVDGSADINLSGNMSVEGTYSAYGVISTGETGEGTTTITGNGTNEISVTAEGDNVCACGILNDAGSVTLKNIGSMTVSSNGDVAEANGVYVEGPASVVIDGIQDIKVESSGNAYGIDAFTIDEDTNVQVNITGELSATSTEEGGYSYAIYTFGYSDITVDGNGTAEIKAITVDADAGEGGDAYGVYADSLATVTLNNVKSLSAVSTGGEAYAIYSTGEDAVVNVNGKDAEHRTAITGDVLAEDGGAINLKSTAVIGNIEEEKNLAGYGTIKFLGTNTVDGAVTLQGNKSVTMAADSYSLTQVGNDATDTIAYNGNLSVSGEGSSVAITGKAPTVESNVKTYYANITGTATAGEGASLSLTNVEVGGIVTNNGIMNLNDVKVKSLTNNDGAKVIGTSITTTNGWTLAEGSVTVVDAIVNGTDMTAMSKQGTINGSIYASSGILDLRGVDLRLKGEPNVFGGTPENPKTLDTLKATRVLFGDIYDGSNNLTIKNIIMENCTTEYRAAVGVYYDSLTVDNISVDAPENWYWTQQYQDYNYQMYTGYGGTLTVNESLTTGEFMNASSSLGYKGTLNLADGAVLNCLDFQNTGNVTEETLAAGNVHVNGAGATLNAAALNNHAITTLGTVNLTGHPVMYDSVPNANYGEGAVLTIGTLNFKQVETGAVKNYFRIGDNAVTTIGALTSSAIGADFYVTGTSDATVNKDGGKAVQYIGDIVFASYSDSTSDGTKFSLNLDSSDDYFTGSVRGTTSAKARWGKWGWPVNDDAVASTNNIKGMTLNLSNGATWTMTGDSFVNNLTIDGATIAKQGDVVPVLTLQDGTSTLKDATINAKVLVKGGTVTGTKGTTGTVLNGGLEVVDGGQVTLQGSGSISADKFAIHADSFDGKTASTVIIGDTDSEWNIDGMVYVAHNAAYGSSHNAVVNLNGRVTIDGSYASAGTGNMDRYAAVRVNDGGVINIVGGKNKVTINEKNLTDNTTASYGAIGIYAYSHEYSAASFVNISSTEEVEINVDGSNQNHGVIVGLYAQNCLKKAGSDNVSTITIDAPQTTIKLTKGSSDTVGIVAMSEGVVDIKGGLKLTADAIISTRGDAKTFINKEGKGTVQLQGDIEFDYNKATSRTKIDALVDLNLTNSDSYWTGEIVKGGDVDPIPEDKAAVYGMKLTLKNGATWTMTGDSFVNNLTVDGATIAKDDATVHKLTLQDGTSTLKDATINAKVLVKSGTVTGEKGKTGTSVTGGIEVSDGAVVTFADNLTTETKRTEANSQEDTHIRGLYATGVGTQITINGNLTANATDEVGTTDHDVRAIQTQTGGTITIDNANAGKTGSVTLSAKGKNSETAYGALALGMGANIDIVTNILDVDVECGTGLHVGSNIATGVTDGTAKLIVKADTVNIDAKGVDAKDAALQSLSSGTLKIDGTNININQGAGSAGRALVTRGKAETYINSAAVKGTVKMKGNIEFEYDSQTSGSAVDAKVDIYLTDEDSFWTGVAKVVSATAVEIPENYDKVSALGLNLSNGATWNLTGNSIVNNLTVNAAKVKLNTGVTSATVDAINDAAASTNVVLTDAVFDSGVTLNLDAKSVAEVSGALGVAKVTGDGLVKLASDAVTVAIDSDIAKLDGNGKTIDMQQTSGTVAYNTLKVGTLAGDANLKIDAKMTGNTGDAGRNDKLVITDANGKTITLKSVNITADQGNPINNIAVITGTGASALTLENATLTTMTNKYVYTFAKDGTNAGELTVSRVASSGGLRSYLTIDNGSTTYSFENNLNYSDAALDATTDGVDTTKDVTMNGYALTGYGTDDQGITVTSGTTLNLDGANAVEGEANSVISNFGTALTVNSGGIANVKDVNFTGNTTDINNAGTVNFSGTNVLNTLSGGGTANNSGALTAGSAVSNAVINSGTFTANGAVSGAVDNSGTFTANAAVTSAITNTGTFNVSATNLRGAVANTDGTVNLGVGTLAVAVNGGTLNINDDVTANAGYIGGVTNTVAADKTLTLNSGAVANAISNSGTVALTNVTGMSAAVTGGTLSIEQDLTTSADYIKGATNIVAETKTLTLNSGAVANAISNSGTVALTNVTGMSAAVTGGTLSIEQDLTTSADYIKGATNTVAETKTLTLNGGAVTNAITNNGTVALTGVTALSAAVTGGTLSLEQNLTTSADYIKGAANNIAADKTLTLNGGTLTVAMGDATHTTGTLKIASGATVTDSAAVYTALDNAGTFTAGGALNGEVTNTGTLTANEAVSGAVINSGTFTANKAVSGAVTNSGTLTANGAVTSAVTNSGTLNISADNLQGAVANTDGTVNLGAGALGVAVTGGMVALTGNVSSVGGNFVSNTLVDLNGKDLTVTDGALTVAMGDASHTTGTLKIASGGTVTDSAAVYTALNNAGSFTANGALKGAVTNSGMLTVNAAVTGAVTNSGTLNVNADVQGTVGNTGTVNLNAGKYSDVGTSDYVALSNFTGAGKFNLDKLAVYNTTSGNVFNSKIADVDIYAASVKDADAKNAFVTANKSLPTGLVTNKLTFVGGTIELTDTYYTADYAKNAKALLGDFKYDGTNLSQTALVFTGTIVSAVEWKDDDKGTSGAEGKVLLDEIIEHDEEQSQGQEETKKIVYDTVVAETLNGSLLVGKNLDADVSTEVKAATGGDEDGIDVKESTEKGFSVAQLDLANDATGVVITNKEDVTVGGSAANGAKDAVQVVTVNGKSDTDVKVVVGLDKSTAVAIGLEETDNSGVLNIGNIKADPENAKYELKGTVVINPDSEMNVNGQVAITNGIILTDAKVDVAEKAKVVVPTVEVTDSNNASVVTGVIEANTSVQIKNGILEVGIDEESGQAAQPAELITPLFQLDDSSAHVGQAAVVKATEITVDSTEKDNQSKSSVITGKVTAKTLTMNQATVTEGDATTVLHVGTEDKQANVEVGETNLQGNMLFLDPAWQNGVGLEGASHYATGAGNLNGAYVVGQNSMLTFGASNADADALFAKTKLAWAKNGVTAAAYVADQINVAGGSLTVDGHLTTENLVTELSRTPVSGTVNFAANSLLMVDGAKVQNKTAIKGVGTVSVDNTSKLFISEAVKDVDYHILAGSLGSVDWQNSNILSNASVTLESAKIVNGEYIVRFGIVSDPQICKETVIPRVSKSMLVDSVNDSSAYKFMQAATAGIYSENEQAQHIDAAADFGINLGVSRVAYDVANLVGDAVTEHEAMVRVDEELETRHNVWATYANTKDKVDGLHMGGMDAKYEVKLNGAVVGCDVTPGFGLALSYTDGEVTGAGGHNDVEYSGVGIYANRSMGRVNVLWDATYLHGKNDLLGNVAGVALDADARVNVVTTGLRISTDVKDGNAVLTPFAGLRYMCIDGDAYANNLGLNYAADTMDVTMLKAGLRYAGNVGRKGCSFRPAVEAGYIYNLSNKENLMWVGYKTAYDVFGYDVVDNGAFYGKASLGFTADRFSADLGYRYLKSSNAKDNKWFINLNYAF